MYEQMIHLKDMSTCWAGQSSLILRRAILSNWFALKVCGKDKIQLSKRGACKQVKSESCIFIKRGDAFSSEYAEKNTSVTMWRENMFTKELLCVLFFDVLCYMFSWLLLCPVLRA